MSRGNFLLINSKILNQMGPVDHIDPSRVSRLVEQLNAHAQEDSGDALGVSPGWLFKGLTFYFHHPSSSSEVDSGSPSREREANSSRLRLATNVARFAGAGIASSLNDNSVTHVVVDADISSTETSSLRGSLSKQLGKRKIPHLITVQWVEQSWEERTLLDEERKSLFLFLSYTYRLPDLFLW